MSCQEFRNRLLIDCDGTPRLLSEVADPWQQADFDALDPGWESVAGAPCEPDYLRGYLERPRGHSKTGDIAAMVAYVLYATPRLIRGVAAAADKEQAGFLKDGIEKLVKLNPWLAERLAVRTSRVVNRKTGSVLKIISNDANSSFGATPDFVVIDELTHWKKRGLWDSLISALAKRARCMVVVISNAGFGQGTSWQWDARELCRADRAWHFSRLDGPQASWITEDRLAEQRRLLPTKAYLRLWLNQWTRETGDGLDWMDIEACTTLAGPMAEYSDQFYPFFGALDLGLKNDHAALIVLGIDVPAQRLRLARCHSWIPAQHDGQVKLAQVRETCLDVAKAFQLIAMVYDPYQCQLMAEDLAANGLQMIPCSFQAKNADRMAKAVLQVFRNRQIDLYHDRLLMDDLMRIAIEERPIGYKITATRDDRGHADRAIALAMGVPYGVEWMKELAAGSSQEETYSQVCA